jgi:NTP pyrophosphatase (non-canonical NTP hydrolase)
MNEIADQIIAWATETFPHATPNTNTLKLIEEIHELFARNERTPITEAVDAIDPEELADVGICLVCLAHSLGRNLVQEMTDKLAINKTRTYDSQDVSRHV